MFVPMSIDYKKSFGMMLSILKRLRSYGPTTTSARRLLAESAMMLWTDALVIVKWLSCNLRGVIKWLQTYKRSEKALGMEE